MERCNTRSAAGARQATENPALWSLSDCPISPAAVGINRKRSTKPLRKGTPLVKHCCSAMLDDGVRSTSSIDQAELERRVTTLYAKEYSLGEGTLPPPPAPPLAAAAAVGPPTTNLPRLCAGGFDPDDEGLLLDRKAHAKYLSDGLGSLPSGACTQVASRTSTECCPLWPPNVPIHMHRYAWPIRFMQASSPWMPPVPGSAIGSHMGEAARGGVDGSGTQLCNCTAKVFSSGSAVLAPASCTQRLAVVSCVWTSRLPAPHAVRPCAAVVGCRLALLGATLPASPSRESVIAFLASCQVGWAAFCK